MTQTDEEQGYATHGTGVVVRPVDNDQSPAHDDCHDDDHASPPSSSYYYSSSEAAAMRDDDESDAAAAKQQQQKTLAKGAECRICLSSEQSESFVQPCLCDGSLKYAHLHCLKSWVHERQRLSCEICKAKYAEPLLPELKEEMHDPDHAGSGGSVTRQGYTVDDNHSPRVFILPGMAHDGSNTRQRNNNKALINIFIIAFVIIVIVVILVVLGLNASQHTWAAVLLRIIAFGLPLLIIGRAFIVCCEMRRTSATLSNQHTYDNPRSTNASSFYVMS
ncbi:hypothetical protein M9434_004367 [Picochlorum sp. BPE23]|nr:hypothetical protein M9434_004367 [Picochlorum sp. BPE23]